MSEAVKVPMVAIVVFLSLSGRDHRCLDGGPWPGERSARSRQARSRAEDGMRRLFCAARNAAPSRQGKKADEAVAGRRSRHCRPSGLIRPSEVAWVGARERTDGDHHDHRKHRHPTTWHRRSQQGLRSRIKTKDGATWRMTAHAYASRRSPWGGPKRPRGEHGSNLGVRPDATPASINSSVKGRDSSFALIWSRRTAK